LSSAPVLAQQSEGEATRLEFRAPAGCSSSEDFAARVRKRSWRIRLVPDAQARRLLRVEIQEPSAGSTTLRGTVTVVEPDGATRTRQLKAATCAEAVDALSLIATVTLDPDAMLGEPEPEPAPAPKPKPAPAAPVSPPKKRQPPPRFRRAPPVELYRFSFGLEAAALFRLSPEPALGGGVTAAIEMNPGALLSPFWRLSLTHAQLRKSDVPGGEASFAFTLPTIETCPFRFGPKALSLRPCAFASVGLLKAWASGPDVRGETKSRLSGSAGLAGFVGWRISETFEIIADGRAGLAFRRDRFALDQVTFFTTETLVFSAAVGVAGGFP
jgi:hypothetical protein